MNKKLIKDFNLPKYTKGKTFAEASKAINNKFKDRNDIHATKTKEELLERLAKAQEYTKMQESLASNSQQVPDQMNGQVPEGMQEFAQPQQEMQQPIQPQQGQNQMFNGGNMTSLNQYLPEVGQQTQQLTDTMNTGQTGASSIGGYGNMAGTGLEFGNQIFGNSNIDTTGQSGRQEAGSVGGSTASGAMKGASAGMALGPWGAAAGAVIGGASGFIGGKKNKSAADEANRKVSLTESLSHRPNTFQNGGYINPTDPNNPFDVNQARSGTMGNVMDQPNLSNPMNLGSRDTAWNRPNPNMYQSNTAGETMGNPPPQEQSAVGKTVGQAADWMGQNYGDLMSYAPVVGNLTADIKPANTPRGTRLNNRYNPNYVDESQLINQVNQNNVNSALSEASGGDLGALRTNLLGSNLNKTKALSDSYMKANNINRSEDRTAQQFNLGVDRVNLAQDERYIERAARDQGVYESAKNANRNALYEDIGKIGREESNKRIIKGMYGYTWDGDYWVGKDGNKITDQEYRKQVESNTNQNDFGGYLKKKK